MTADTQSALDLIATERARQVEQEGWTPEHDDEHDKGEMVMAAVCYAAPGVVYVRQELRSGVRFLDPWPWDLKWDKRHDWSTGRRFPRPREGDDRIRELAKAGALIAAEIDRLQRLVPDGR